jgi:hypothetical protein
MTIVFAHVLWRIMAYLELVLPPGSHWVPVSDRVICYKLQNDIFV